MKKRSARKRAHLEGEVGTSEEWRERRSILEGAKLLWEAVLVSSDVPLQIQQHPGYKRAPALRLEAVKASYNVPHSCIHREQEGEGGEREANLETHGTLLHSSCGTVELSLPHALTLTHQHELTSSLPHGSLQHSQQLMQHSG